MVAAGLRIGLLGASRVATYAIIAPAHLLSGVEVAAVAARDPRRAAAYAGEYGIPRVHADYADLIADPLIDLIYIGTPPSTHAELALRAIAAGKPVLVEKPFAMTVAEAQAVYDAGRGAGVPIFEAMHSLHHRLFARLDALRHSAAIGKFRHLTAEFSVPIPQHHDELRWRSDLGGGALMDLGVYPLAWCRRMAGEFFAVSEAHAEMRSGVDARFEARLRFAGGATAAIRSSMIADRPIARLSITGATGSIVIENPLAPQRGHVLRLTVDGRTTDETVPGPTTYAAQLLALRATLIDGEPFPFPADDYIRSMEAIEAVRARF